MKKQTMLLNKLYTLVSFGFSEEKDKISAKILLNREHPVFGGHFPGNPILPGACTVQIIRELLEKAAGKELVLNKAASIKYLGFINPVKTSEILFDFLFKQTDTGSFFCIASVSAGGNVVCSFKGEYT